MSDFGKHTLRWLGVLLGVLIGIGMTGGLDDPASPCYGVAYEHCR